MLRELWRYNSRHILVTGLTIGREHAGSTAVSIRTGELNACLGESAPRMHYNTSYGINEAYGNTGELSLTEGSTGNGY